MLIDIPNKIGSAKTLFIAETDGVFDIVERNDEKIEIVFITVCQYDADNGYYLFGCDKEFGTHTDFYYDDLEEALDDAKRIYDLKQIKWREYLPKMEFADTVEIYLSVIDGVQVWVPTKAKLLSDNQYLLLNNNEFDCTDYSSLPEFIPGDTITAGQKPFDTGDTKKIAIKLISPSKHPDKSFFDFLYQATTGYLQPDKITYDKFRNEITRVKVEFSEGRYFYPSILDLVNSFDKTESIK
jgi:hypothetical protein